MAPLLLAGRASDGQPARTGGPGWEEKEAGGSAVSSLCPEDVASRGNVTCAF